MCDTQVIAKMKEIFVFFVKTNLQVLPLDPVLCSSSAFCCACICSCLASITVLDGTFVLGSRRPGFCSCPNEYSVLQERLENLWDTFLQINPKTHIILGRQCIDQGSAG